MIPIKYGHSKKLISHDVNSNTYNYKYTFSVEVIPVCKDNVVALPKQMAHHLGGIGQIIVVNKVHQVNRICPDVMESNFIDLSGAAFNRS